MPLNIFGNGNASPAALEYAFRTLKEDNEYTQDVLGVNFRSTLGEGWAGPIALATGFEWRADEAETTHDLANQPWYSSYLLSYGLDRGGDIDVLEAYAELDVPMTQKLNTNFSVRQTQNEATSSQNADGLGRGHVRELEGGRDLRSARVAAVPHDGFAGRARGRLPRALPAARHDSRLSPRSTILGTRRLTDTSFAATTGGNPDLEPETADTMTFGAVFSFDRFRLSADWFEIDLADAITQSPGNQPLVDACFTSGGTGPACDRIDGRGDGRHHGHRFGRDEPGRVPDERLGLRGDLRLPAARRAATSTCGSSERISTT